MGRMNFEPFTTRRHCPFGCRLEILLHAANIGFVHLAASTLVSVSPKARALGAMLGHPPVLSVEVRPAFPGPGG